MSVFIYLAAVPSSWQLARNHEQNLGHGATHPRRHWNWNMCVFIHFTAVDFSQQLSLAWFTCSFVQAALTSSSIHRQGSPFPQVWEILQTGILPFQVLTFCTLAITWQLVLGFVPWCFWWPLGSPKWCYRIKDIWWVLTFHWKVTCGLMLHQWNLQTSTFISPFGQILYHWLLWL